MFSNSGSVRLPLRGRIPQGETLPAPAWATRHRGVLLLLAGHALVLPVFGLWMGAEPWHAVVEGLIIAAVAGLAAIPSLGRRTRSVLAAFGLMSASGVLVHLSGGYIEAHFHFFVMLGVVFLYEDWLPYVLSVGYVAVHHGIVGSVDPRSVYNHPAAIAEPWTWALIHALFILGLSAALLISWNVTDTARRSEVAARDELRGLRRQLAAQEKMAALGSLASGLAHEIRTPLTVISTNAHLLIARGRARGAVGADGADLERSLEDIETSVDRINGLVLQMRRFVRHEGEERRRLPLAPVVDEAVQLYLAANRGAPVVAKLEATPAVDVDAVAVQQIVVNLVSNAVEALENGAGGVRVRTFERDGAAVLSVEDDGCGMAEDVRTRIFEPLFTTKATGMGLGLSIVRRLVDQHEAAIEVDSLPGRGTRVRVAFAAASTAAAPPAPTETRGAPAAL